VAEKIRFYVDEHIARAVVIGLRQRGIDVLTVPEANLLGAADEKQLAFARREGRVLFTRDADFLHLHASGLPHAGIVYTSRRVSIGDMIRGLALIHEILDVDDMQGRVEYL
jgi:predicted nuclease of predicted toxin-antitoxin system